MSKQKEEKTNVMRVLDQKKVPYTPHAYPVGDAAPDGVSVAQMLGQDPAAVLRLMGDKLKATHISDFFNIDSDHLPPFQGRVDWPPIMEALRDIRYAGDFTYEIHRFTSTMPEELVPEALAYTVRIGEYLLSL